MSVSGPVLERRVRLLVEASEAATDAELALWRLAARAELLAMEWPRILGAGPVLDEIEESVAAGDALRELGSLLAQLALQESLKLRVFRDRRGTSG